VKDHTELDKMSETDQDFLCVSPVTISMLLLDPLGINFLNQETATSRTYHSLLTN